nr:hypothetical protein [Rhodococcus qingshengii]
MAEFNEPIQRALDAIAAFESAINSDLDETISGIAWWATYDELNDHDRAWMSHYFISLPRAIRINLEDVANHLDAYKERAQTTDIQLRSKLIRSGGNAPDMRPHSAVDRRRDAAMQAEPAAFFRAIGSSLDTLGSTIVAVGAIDTDLVKAGWSDVRPRDVELWPRVPKSKLGKQLMNVGTGGAIIQDELLQVLREAVRDAGPPHWSEWTMNMRNALVHRARWANFVLHENHGKHRPPSFYRPLPRNPQLPEGAAMREIAGIPDLILSEDAAITMQGILRSAAELVSAVLEQCLKTWAIRREQPDLLRQPNSATPVPSAPFAGYAPGSTDRAFSKIKQMTMHPDDAKRLAALRPHAYTHRDA